MRLRKGRGLEKWAIERGRVMQICARDHVEVHPQKKKEVLYLVKKNLGEIEELSNQLSESESDSPCCHIKCMYIALQRTK